MIENLNGEIWRDVVGYEGLYQVSNKGRVKSCAKIWYAGNGGKREKPETLRKPNYKRIKRSGEIGYNENVFIKNGEKRYFKVSVVEAIAFLPNPENKRCVNHKDGNKQNDNLGNLEWATHKENTRHAYRIGLMEGAKGSENSMAKLTEDQVRQIRENKNNFNPEKLGRLFQVDPAHIRSIVARRRWKHI